ncbi:hypothetical protein Gotur_026356 [Gossypium turneri]
MKKPKQDTKAFSRTNRCTQKKCFTLKENNYIDFMARIRQIGKALNWELFCEKRPSANEELGHEFYANLTSSELIEVFVYGIKVQLHIFVVPAAPIEELVVVRTAPPERLLSANHPTNKFVSLCWSSEPDALACLDEDLKGKFSLKSVRVFIHVVTDVNTAHDRAPLFCIDSAASSIDILWPAEHVILFASSLDVCEPRSWPSLSSCKLDLQPCLASWVLGSALRAGSASLLCCPLVVRLALDLLAGLI